MTKFDTLNWYEQYLYKVQSEFEALQKQPNFSMTFEDYVEKEKICQAERYVDRLKLLDPTYIITKTAAIPKIKRRRGKGRKGRRPNHAAALATLTPSSVQMEHDHEHDHRNDQKQHLQTNQDQKEEIHSIPFCVIKAELEEEWKRLENIH